MSFGPRKGQQNFDGTSIHGDEIERRIDEAADTELINRLRHEQHCSSWDEDKCDCPVGEVRERITTLTKQRNRLRQTVKYFATIGGHWYLLPIGSPYAQERQMTATEVIHRVAKAALDDIASGGLRNG